MNCEELIGAVRQGRLDGDLKLLYGCGADTLAFQRSRYISCIEAFKKLYGEGGGVRLLSVPGRSEVGGNHTDHNFGRVLACAVDLDVIAAVRPRGDGTMHVKSEGFDEDVVELSCLTPRENERTHSPALVRGVAADLRQRGYKVGGFEAFTTSRVLKGSGLSSSAAFEVMMGLITSALYNGGGIDPVVLAQAGQFAEREFFGKPCGLMDQTACAVGGFIAIDFEDNAHPRIEKLDFDFASTGYRLCIVDTGGSHSDLTDDYAAIQSEMKGVARLMGREVLRQCSEKEFFSRLPELRQKAGDRAVLRAIHFFGDNARVVGETAALRRGDFGAFMSLVTESGRSSFMYLQNCYAIKSPREQGVPLALALAQKVLGADGAWRVHGGGFAGTVQAFVPQAKLAQFTDAMTSVFGPGACYCLLVRPRGAYEFKI
jgi:galactokinase